MSQLSLLDLLPTPAPPARRVRPPDRHQRGWIVLPYDTAGLGPAGTYVPAWVCCRCAGATTGRYRHERDHDCCNPNTVNHPCDRKHRWPGWALALDAAWTAERPAS